MLLRTSPVCLLAALFLTAPAQAQSADPQIDYPAFSALVRDLAPVRAGHRLAWPEFARRARAEGALLLDARSADAFARGHLEGAVNLPFTDFTDEALARVVGADPGRPIYIYCNNNFRDHAPPVPLKRAPMALNIPTFISLHGYGYRNVWELADMIGMDDPGIGWARGEG